MFALAAFLIFGSILAILVNLMEGPSAPRPMPWEVPMNINHSSALFCSPGWPQCAMPPREADYQNLCDLLSEWSPDDPSPHPITRDPLPVLSYSDPAERAIAESYREAELPFVLKDLGQLSDAQALWTDDYMESRFQVMERSKSPKFKVDRSTRSGHFLYFKAPRGSIRGWSAPQTAEKGMRYREFLDIAKAADQHNDLSAGALYLTISAGMGGTLEWVVESLSFFRDNKFFRVNFPSKFHGINCRFGMKGVVQV